MHRQSHISIPHKLFSVAILTLCITILLVYSCDKDKEKSIVGPGEDTYTISGKVVENLGFGAIYVTVTIIGTNVSDSAKTDSLGAYSFEGLSAGEYTITPERGKFNFFPSNTEVSITDSNVEVDNFYTGWFGGESIIVGKILDVDANPVSGVYVLVTQGPSNPKRGGGGHTNGYGFFWGSLICLIYLTLAAFIFSIIFWWTKRLKIKNKKR